MSIFDSVSKTINSVFGTTVTYHYEDGSPDSTIVGVFDNAYIESNGVSTRSPILRNVTLADLSAEPNTEGDTVTINSVVYRVTESQPDSFGATILILQRQ